MIRSILNFVLAPQKLPFKVWGKLQMGSFRMRLDYDVFPRPHYAFCLYHAAKQASRLGHKRISALEFGVAGGLGLIELEQLSNLIEKEFDITIEIYGFDTGEGLPAPVDYRDLPYIWQEGFFAMDQDALNARLKRSKLVIGNVKDTVPSFIENYNPAPIAAVYMDLDYWSSTLDAMKIFQNKDDHMLPRVFTYFDDVSSAEDGGLLNEFVGQLAAINDYNQMHAMQKMTTIAGFARQRKIQAPWNEKIYVHHSFGHSDYNKYIHEDRDRQLSI